LQHCSQHPSFGKSPKALQLMNGLRIVLYIMEYYSAVKKNEIMLFAGKWMELKIIMLSEVSHDQKDKGHIFSLICGR
jgi:hypothetical protein